VIVDLMGFFDNDPTVGDTGSQLSGVAPQRILDTRVGNGIAAGKVVAGSTIALQTAGRAAIPLDATAVVLNVTVTGAESEGYVTVYPCGSIRPTSSNLNYVRGQTVPNAVIVGVGAGGSVCFYSEATVDLIADVNGYFSASSARDFLGVRPRRVVDSRVQPFAGLDAPEKVDAGGRILLTLSDVAPGTPVAFNVTVTQPETDGYVTVYPCAAGLPNASNLNFVADQTVANAVVVTTDAQQRVCFQTTATTHMIVDFSGAYFLASEIAAMRGQ
jgi:hypothetical protein